MAYEYLNPEHPATRAVQAHKEAILAALVGKVGGVRLTHEDFEAVNGMVLLTHTHSGSIELRIVTKEEAQRLQEEAQNGGAEG